MLALRGPSWIKASGALAGCILGLAARLTRHFFFLPDARHRAGQSNERPKSTESGAAKFWRRDNVWSGHQRISETCLTEIHRASPPTVNFIVINITSGVTSAISPGRAGEKHRRYNQTQTRAQPQIQLIHAGRQPLYLIACLAPLLFHSRFSLSLKWHGSPCVEGGCYPPGPERGGRLKRVSVCLYASIGEIQRVGNKRKGRKKRRGVKRQNEPL